MLPGTFPSRFGQNKEPDFQFLTRGPIPYWCWIPVTESRETHQREKKYTWYLYAESSGSMCIYTRHVSRKQGTQSQTKKHHTFTLYVLYAAESFTYPDCVCVIHIKTVICNHLDQSHPVSMPTPHLGESTLCGRKVQDRDIGRTAARLFGHAKVVENRERQRSPRKTTPDDLYRYRVLIRNRERRQSEKYELLPAVRL